MVKGEKINQSHSETSDTSTNGLIYLRKSYRDSAAQYPDTDKLYWPALSHEKLTFHTLDKHNVNSNNSTMVESSVNIWKERLNSKSSAVNKFKDLQDKGNTHQSGNKQQLKHTNKSKSPIDKCIKDTNNDQDEEGWISVKRKVKKKIQHSSNDKHNKNYTAKLENGTLRKTNFNGRDYKQIKSIVDECEKNQQKKSNYTTCNEKNTTLQLNEEKLTKNKEMRKTLRKEKKKFEREAKARLKLELSRKDTKVQILSHNVIDNYLKRVNAQNPSPRNTGSNKMSHIQRLSDKTYEDNISTQINYAEKVSTYKKKKSKSYNNSNIKKKVNLSSQSKNVKTKDAITIDLMAIAKVKRSAADKHKCREDKFNPQRIQRPPSPKRGKVKAKKRVHTFLKKMIHSERKARKERFLNFLAEQILPEYAANLIGTTEKTLLPSMKNGFEDLENKNKTDIQLQNVTEYLPSQIKPIEVKDLSTTTKGSMSINADDPSPSHSESIADTKADIVNEISILNNTLHNRKFREYCFHFVTPDINAALTEFIKAIVQFQQNLYHRDPVKAKLRRRYYCGLKEAMKHINHYSCLIFPPDIARHPGPGSLDELVNNVIRRGKELNIPIIFGLNMKVLAKLCHRKGVVSCISITSYEGAQDKFSELMTLVQEAKEAYDKKTPLPLTRRVPTKPLIPSENSLEQHSPRPKETSIPSEKTSEQQQQRSLRPKDTSITSNNSSEKQQLSPGRKRTPISHNSSEQQQQRSLRPKQTSVPSNNSSEQQQLSPARKQTPISHNFSEQQQLSPARKQTPISHNSSEQQQQHSLRSKQTSVPSNNSSEQRSPGRKQMPIYHNSSEQQQQRSLGPKQTSVPSNNSSEQQQLSPARKQTPITHNSSEQQQHRSLGPKHTSVLSKNSSEQQQYRSLESKHTSVPFDNSSEQQPLKRS